MQFHQLGPNFRTLVWIRTFLSRMVWKMLINYKFLEFSTPYLQKWYDTRGIQSLSKSYIGSSRQVIDVNINHLSLFDGMLVKGACIYFPISTDQAFKASAPWMVTTCLKNWPFLGQKMLFWVKFKIMPFGPLHLTLNDKRSNRLWPFSCSECILGQIKKWSMLHIPRREDSDFPDI